MDRVFSVAKMNFLRDFLSLKGTVVVFFFSLIGGLFFYSYMDTYVSAQLKYSDLGRDPISVGTVITGYFNVLRFLLILVVPAITMASLAEEKKNHTDRLLLSSPISPSVKDNSSLFF